MIQLIGEFVPSLHVVAIWTAPILLYGVFVAWVVGILRHGWNIQTPYTRKIFHFAIFTMAALIQWMAGRGAVGWFGMLTAALVLYAVWRGNGFPFYEALARPSDRPHRTLFILIPLLTTALGGLTSNLLFDRYATVGYLVCGWGDAMGEPVGARWGRHRYRVPSLAGVPAERSLEGSAAVWAMGSLAAVVGLTIEPLSWTTLLFAGTVLGLVGTVVEAFSNHGIDNFTIQVAVSAAAAVILT